MKIGVRLVGLREARFEARLAELRARIGNTRRASPARSDTTTDWQEVSDGERELDPAAGGFRDADE